MPSSLSTIPLTCQRTCGHRAAGQLQGSTGLQRCPYKRAGCHKLLVNNINSTISGTVGDINNGLAGITTELQNAINGFYDALNEAVGLFSGMSIPVVQVRNVTSVGFEA